MPRRPHRYLALAPVAGALVLGLGVALSGGSTSTDGGDRRTTTPSGSPRAQPPAPDARLPRDPRRLATRLRETTVALGTAIDRWRSSGNPARGRPPRAVTLYALHQQRIYRRLADRRRLARATIRRLPRRLRGAARDNVGALGDLGRLTPPTPKGHKLKTATPRPAGELLRYYRKAQRRFRVGWHVLAAINLVESAYGRLRNDSVAGAQGPMQFIPATWRAYGMGGDVHDPHDAIMGAANYLRASGAPGSYRRALYAYNPSQLYVDAVLAYARRIRRSPRAYFAYYSWQVFVGTPSGERRLTGPGLR